MEHVKNAIYNRRSVRKYKNSNIERTLINELINAGCMAPSDMNSQAWKFYVITDPELIDHLDNQVCIVVSELYTMPEMNQFLRAKHPIFHHAPVVVFITGPRTSEWVCIDVGMCAQNMMLLANAAGLDTCPVGLAKFVERTSFYTQLEIPADEQVLLALCIGYGDENPALPERRTGNVFYVRSGVQSRPRPIR